ncbi:helix-turn-helix transcriptional regulator [Jutongia sp.]|uniref:helix-turn-helix domain-containing protein n=1 Tax=Jutongia sp. TaxID=2944204 RepID=UPI00307B013F
MGDFPNIFKHIREKSGLTQQQLADKLGISRSAVGMYEKGEREPNFETLELIADTFNVDMNYLLGKKPSTEVIPDTYYFNPETSKIAQEIYDNKELSLLFDAARDADPEDLQTVHSMLMALKRKEKGQ